MNPATSGDYLETEVMTAAPQKLQLMLIDAALRQSRAAQEFWKNEQPEQAGEALIRAQQIITELLCGLNPEKDKQLTSKVAGVYLFVFRALLSAQTDRDEAKLQEAISVLEIEQETWQQVCSKLGTKRTTPAPHVGGSMTSSPTTSLEA